MEPTGCNLVAGKERRDGEPTYRSVDPETGQPFGPEFYDATESEVTDAVSAAVAAFGELRELSPEVIASLLEDIADRLLDLGDALLEIAVRETGLGRQRIAGERRRTCGQLRAFAQVVAERSHLDIRIDTADETTTPPRPDLRRMQVPIGPVAVFGASNFPLAFGVPGGDTASALAAGCPVVAKAHPAHPATSEVCARAIIDAVDSAGLPGGAFSLLHGEDVGVSRALVLADGIEAVGFTGSEVAGRALYDLGAGREKPIPVYAEMGSLNPQFVTPRALEQRGPEIAEGLVASMTLGTGQFCTKPGVVFIPDSPSGRDFETEIAARAGSVDPAVLLADSICTGLQERLSMTKRLPDVEVLVEDGGNDTQGFRAGPTVLAVTQQTFRRHPELSQEHFGPVAVLVRVGSLQDMVAVAKGLPGSLSASVHGTEDDAADVDALLRELREVAGRVIWNQFPTGVAVTHAMHHGGPYPAATFSAHTSVGSAAVRRFLRPVAYQNTPQSLLPAPLRNDTSGVLRMVDGTMTDAAIG